MVYEMSFQTAAGTIASIIFISANVPMVLKAFRTRDLSSYSFANIAMCNLGNLFYWFYVFSLPFGPIWFLHGFYTIATLSMLYMYLHYEPITTSLRQTSDNNYRKVSKTT